MPAISSSKRPSGVAEVESETSASRDHRIKTPTYLAGGVPEVWVVEWLNGPVTVVRYRPDAEPERFTSRVKFPVGHEVEFEVAELSNPLFRI